MTQTYDLTSEPWIKVRTLFGASERVSLAQALAGAHEIRSINGEIATQDFAVLRLLLAVVRRSYPALRDADGWADLWERGRFDPAPIAAYLGEHRDRFDLLHPVTPFFQVAGLNTAKGEMTSLARLIADVPTGHQYFTTRAGRALASMDFAEAARWVVHCQGFDVSGIKSGAVGDPRVKGGKGYPIGFGWAGWLGGIVVEGGNLFETLLLNLPLPDGLPAAERDFPVWERPPQNAAPDERPGVPTGPVDLLTWQSRRIRLGHDGGRATGVLICNGDPLHPRDLFDREYMTSWRYSEAQTKARKSAVPVLMPRGHQPDQALWRGLASLLVQTEDSSTSGASRTGGWLAWLHELRDGGILPENFGLVIQAVGVHYGSQSAVIDDIVDDRMALRLAVLTDGSLRDLALSGVSYVDNAAKALGSLGGDIAEAAGGDSAPARSDARARAYAALDETYRRWVARLRSDSDLAEERAQWQQTIRSTVLSLADELVRGAPDAAWIGREVVRGNRPLQLDAAVAERFFRSALRKALGEIPNDDFTGSTSEGEAS